MQGAATVPAGVSVAGALMAGGAAGATPKMASAASSVTALRVVTPGGMSASQPSALRVTPVSSGVRSAGLCFCELSLVASVSCVSSSGFVDVAYGAVCCSLCS